MRQKLSDRLIKGLPAPERGNKLHYDTEVRRLAVRVTKAGEKAFVFAYRVAVRERRMTIGSAADWTTKDAREEAKRFGRMVDAGIDALEQKQSAHSVPTVADLWAAYSDPKTGHLRQRRPSALANARQIMDAWVLPALGSKQLAGLEHADFRKLHAAVTRGNPKKDCAAGRSGQTVSIASSDIN